MPKVRYPGVSSPYLFHNLLVLLHQAVLLLEYKPMASTPRCPLTVSGYRVFFAHAPSCVGALGPCALWAFYSSHHTPPPWPCLCFLHPASSIDSPEPSKPWSNSTSSLNPKSVGGMPGALSSSPYPKSATQHGQDLYTFVL